jgi:hypothetical protein
MKKAKIIGAGPLMVMDTEVFGEHKSKPEYSFLTSSKVETETPELPIFPQISGRLSGSAPYNVTESNAVESRVAGRPSDT